MSRGPKPAPAAVVAQKTTIRSARKPKPEQPSIEPVTSGLTPPDWLKDEALAIWHRQVPALSSAKLLTIVDIGAFARYCRNFARWMKMQGMIDENGETYSVETASGSVHRPRPEFLIADRLERQLLAIEDRFGINPAERQRIMASRAQTGRTGDLFGNDQPPAAQKAKPDPAAKPVPAAKPTQGPVGFLN